MQMLIDTLQIIALLCVGMAVWECSKILKGLIKQVKENYEEIMRIEKERKENLKVRIDK